MRLTEQTKMHYRAKLHQNLKYRHCSYP